jgi:hypothetical protein
MIFCLRHPKNSTKKLLDLINTFSKVAGYEIEIQKSAAIPYPTINRLRKNSGKHSHSQ